MVTRAEIVREAREWLGTRYQHQAHTKRVATDCGGTVYGVGLNLGLLPDAAAWPEAHIFRGYARVATNGSLRRACRLVLEQIDVDDMQPGDVFLMVFDDEPQHVGIIGDYVHGGLSIIHAYARVRCVVESRLDDSFRSRIVEAYRYPGVEA